jgi:hypothetical protein
VIAPVPNARSSGIGIAVPSRVEKLPAGVSYTLKADKSFGIRTCPLGMLQSRRAKFSL